MTEHALLFEADDEAHKMSNVLMQGPHVLSSRMSENRFEVFVAVMHLINLYFSCNTDVSGWLKLWYCFGTTCAAVIAVTFKLCFYG